MKKRKERVSKKDTYTELRKTFYECRNFEINNLWQKSVLLTAFIVLTFTVYVSIISRIFDVSNPINKIVIHEICSSIALVGFVFAIIWIKMGKGSKAWYEVYEHAILTKLKALTIQEGTVIIGSVVSEITNAKKFFTLSISGATSVDLTNIHYLQNYCNQVSIYGPENGTTTVKNMDLSSLINLEKVEVGRAKVESGSFDFSSTKVFDIHAYNIAVDTGVGTDLKLGVYDLSTNNSFVSVKITKCPFTKVDFGTTNAYPHTTAWFRFEANECKNITTLDASKIKSSNDQPLQILCFSCPSSSLTSVSFPDTIQFDKSGLGIDLSNNRLSNLNLPLKLDGTIAYMNSIDVSRNQLNNITFKDGTYDLKFDGSKAQFDLTLSLYGNKFNVLANKPYYTLMFIIFQKKLTFESHYTNPKNLKIYLFTENTSSSSSAGYATTEKNNFSEGFVKGIKNNDPKIKIYKYNQQGVIQDYYVTN